MNQQEACDGVLRLSDNGVAAEHMFNNTDMY